MEKEEKTIRKMVHDEMISRRHLLSPEEARRIQDHNKNLKGRKARRRNK